MENIFRKRYCTLIAYANVLVYCAIYAAATVNTFTYINASMHSQTCYTAYICVYIYMHIYICLHRWTTDPEITTLTRFALWIPYAADEREMKCTEYCSHSRKITWYFSNNESHQISTNSTCKFTFWQIT